MNCLDEIKQQIDTEYELQRTGTEQQSWINEIQSKIFLCESAQKELRLLKPPFKRFIEEAIPIAQLCTAKSEFQSVIVTLRPGNQPFDAEISIHGKTEYIEVVNSVNGHLHNKNMKVFNEGVGLTGYQNQSSAKKIIEDIKSKVSKPYSGSYHLLICFTLDDDLCDVPALIKDAGDIFKNQSTFKSFSFYERGEKRITFV